MAQKPKYGTNLYHRRTRKKRPRIHSKKPNKKNKRKRYVGQGRA